MANDCRWMRLIGSDVHDGALYLIVCNAATDDYSLANSLSPISKCHFRRGCNWHSTISFLSQLAHSEKGWRRTCSLPRGKEEAHSTGRVLRGRLGRPLATSPEAAGYSHSASRTKGLLPAERAHLSLNPTKQLEPYSDSRHRLDTSKPWRN